MKTPSWRANGSRECAPDDGLREANHEARDRTGLLCRLRFSQGRRSIHDGGGDGECDGNGGRGGSGRGGSRHAPALRPAIIQ
jgi:hypothetical protein